MNFPVSLNDTGERYVEDADLEIKLKLPEIWRMSVNSQITEKINVGATIDHYRWHACCGDKSGDIEVTLTDKQGNAIGSGDNSRASTEISKKIYSPRRLWDATNYTLFAGYKANNNLWLGGRVGYNQNAVPEYAVSPTNLDFENAGFQLGARYTFGDEENPGPWTVGLSYAKFFLYERKITNSAWQGGGPDERFHPTDPPLNVSADGHYRGAVDIVGLRVEFKK